MMTRRESAALLKYIESQLLYFADQIVAMDNISPEVSFMIYDSIYEILNDLDQTIETDICLKSNQFLNHKKS